MSYQGNSVGVLIGSLGLTGSKNSRRQKSSHLILANNITYEDGLLSKEGGASKYNTTAIAGNPEIIGGFDWLPSDGNQRLIVALSDGTLRKDTFGTGSFATTLKSGLDISSEYTQFVTGGKEAAAINRKLFSFNGKNSVQVLSGDGATTTDLLTPPVDWATFKPRFGVIHEGRLWGGGNTNDPHRLYFSTATDHENFTGAGSGTISLFPGDGGQLVAAVSFKGLLIAFKNPTGVYLVDTSDPSIANWRVKKQSGAIGCLGVNAFTVLENDIFFIDQSGQFQLLSSIQEFGDIGSTNLSDINEIKFFLANNFSFNNSPDKVKIVYYAIKNEIHIAAQSKGTVSGNDRRFIIDLSDRNNIKFRSSDRDKPRSLFLVIDSGQQKLYMGENNGFVWKMDQINRNKDGLGYLAEFQTPHLDFSEFDPLLASKVKNGQFLELIVLPTSAATLSASIFWDGSLKSTINFLLDALGVGLGTFILGTDSLAGTLSVNKRQRLIGSGKRLSIKFNNSIANETFNIEEVFIHFTVGDER